MSLLIKQEQDIWELWNESQIENQDNLLVPLKIYSSNNNVDILEATNYLLNRMETMYYVETLYEKRFVYKSHPDWLEGFILCSPVRFSAAEQSCYTKEVLKINQIVDNEGFYVGDSMSLFLCIKPATEIDSYKIISNFNMSIWNETKNTSSLQENTILSNDQYIKLKDKFIDNVSYEELSYILKNKQLPANKTKCIWKGKQKVEAARFCLLFNIKSSKWNKIFNFPEGGELEDNNFPKLRNTGSETPGYKMIGELCKIFPELVKKF